MSYSLLDDPRTEEEPCTFGGENSQTILLPCELKVDGNRDGEVEMGSSADDTEEEKPYRFWVNDDHDVDDEEEPSGDPDWEDGEIQCIRDLEDFSRLRINIGGLHDAFKNGDMGIGLKFKNVESGDDPAIQVYWHLGQGNDSYIKEQAPAALQTLQTAQKSPSESSIIDSSGGFYFKSDSDVLSGLSESYPYIDLLFEGVREGKGELVITIHDSSGNEIGEGAGVWLELLAVRKMYSRGHSKPASAWQAPFDTNPYQSQVVGYEALDSITIEPDPDESDELIVFVHGIHSPGLDFNEATNVFTRDADTIFKRLWWQGYKGRFAFYKWDALNAVLPAEYNQSEYRAWKCGKGLAEYIASLPGSSKNVMAHSQGNNVTCAALRDYGLQIDNYIIMQGAVPAVCYEDNSELYDNIETFGGLPATGAQITIPSPIGIPITVSVPDHPFESPDRVDELGYRGFLDAGNLSIQIINFSNPNDDITGVIWELNQRASKPDGSAVASTRKVTGPWYNYVESNPAGQQLTLTYFASNGRFVTDLHEATAMSVQSNSRSIAHTPGTSGAVTQNVPMDTQFGFGNEHGDQFGRVIQDNLNEFFDELLIQFGIPFNE